MKILITGITGFVGPHLARFIQSEECPAPGLKLVYGTVKSRSDMTKIPEGVATIECELTDPKNVDQVIEEIKPDFIFHLAAQSFVKSSWASPADTWNNNIISELNILEAVRKFCPDCVVQIAGSSEEYGVPMETPIKESHDLLPVSPYAVSKVAQEKLGYQYHKSYQLKIVLTRAFNHTGPGRDQRFAEASFAKQIVDCLENGKNELLVGNLEAVRDYTDVRDMVRAYWLAANSGHYGDPINICTGKGHTMSEVLETLLDIAGITGLEVRQDPSRMRPSDIPVLIGDCTKFTLLTGWTPKIPFRETLIDLYENFANTR